jgi:hypothetical protein
MGQKSSEKAKEQLSPAALEKAAISAVMRRHLGAAEVEPHRSVAGEDVTKAVRAAYRSGLRAGRKAEGQRAESLAAELREVLRWACEEKAPLRRQEIDSIKRVLASWKPGLDRVLTSWQSAHKR